MDGVVRCSSVLFMVECIALCLVSCAEPNLAGQRCSGQALYQYSVAAAVTAVLLSNPLAVEAPKILFRIHGAPYRCCRQLDHSALQLLVSTPT